MQQVLKHGFCRKKNPHCGTHLYLPTTPWLSWTFRLVNKNYTAILYMYFYNKNNKKKEWN